MGSASLPGDAVSPKGVSPRAAAGSAIFVSFVVAGAVTTLLGPILPILISRWSLSDEQAGMSIWHFDDRRRVSERCDSALGI